MKRIFLLLAALLAPSMAMAQANPWASQIEAATTGTTYTLANTDCGKILTFTSSSPVAVTVPSTLLPGCKITEVQAGTGIVYNISGSSAVFLGAYNAIAGQFQVAKVRIIPAGWLVDGQAQTYTPAGGGTGFGTQAPTLPPATFTATTTYYVATSGSSDSYDGLAPTFTSGSHGPWATVAKVNAGSYGPGTAILFNGGQSWATCGPQLVQGVNITSTTPTSGIEISSYGTGKPTFTSNCAGSGSGNQGPKSAVVKVDGANGVFVSNIIAACNNTGTQYGILVQSSANTNGIANVSILGNTVSGCNISTAATSDIAAEIYVGGYDVFGGCEAVNNVLIDRNTVSGTSVSSTDDNGILTWGCASGGSKNTNLTNITVTNNNVKWIGGRASGVYGGGGGNGILCNGCQYTNRAYNTVTAGGYNSTTQAGPGGIWSVNSNNDNINHNEVNNMAPGAPIANAGDWIAYDLDLGDTDSVIQFNHSYNNWGNGLEFYQSGGQTGLWGNNQMRYNVSENDSAGNTTADPYSANQSLGQVSFAGSSGQTPGTAYGYNNTIINTRSTNMGSCLNFYGMPSAGFWANNVCYFNGTSNVVLIDGNALTPAAGMKFVSNDYYLTTGTFAVYSFPGNYGTFAGWAAAAPGGEAGSVQTIPGFTSTPSPAACTVTANVGPQGCPTQLTLGSGSTNKGVGTNLTASIYSLSPGVQDYYGNTIPTTTGTGYDIGAAGN